MGNYFSGTLAYTFQQAKNTGDDPITYLAFGSRIVSQIGGGNSPPPQAILTTSSNRPHTLAFAGSLSFPGDFQQGTAVGAIFRNFGVYVTGRYTSGTSYTGCVNTADNSVLIAVDAATSGPCSSGDFTSDYNGLRMPGLKRLRSPLHQGLRLGGLTMTGLRRCPEHSELHRTSSGSSKATVTSRTRWSTPRTRRSRPTRCGTRPIRTMSSTTRPADITLAGGAGGCAAWVNAGGAPSAPNCVYLVRAEQRFGNGDGAYTIAEQTRAFNSYYNSFRNKNFFTDRPRQVRLGLEVNF